MASLEAMEGPETSGGVSWSYTVEGTYLQRLEVWEAEPAAYVVSLGWLLSHCALQLFEVSSRSQARTGTGHSCFREVTAPFGPSPANAACLALLPEQGREPVP